MRALLLAFAVLACPLTASADPIPLPPPVPHCPDGSRARLLWPSREGYCEPVACDAGHCARGTTCTESCLCIATVHGRPSPDVADADLPNVISVCSRGGAQCMPPAQATSASYCIRPARRPSHHATLQKSAWLPLASLGPLALALGSVPVLRRRRK